MKKMSKTVVFFGSGPVAAKSLELLAKNFVIEAVITKPKPEHHRGDFPVISLAEKLKLPIYTARNKTELSNLITTTSFKSSIGVLIDFGIIVARDVIDAFELGIVNSHFSLLPEWRGADPITFAILSGQPKTGVTLMTIDEGMDTGKILTQKTWHIKPGSTTASLTDELITLSDQLLAEYLPRYVSGDIQPRQQPHPDRATYSRKLNKEDGLLDLSKTAEELEREIRAYSEWPKSYTKLAGKDVIITQAHVSSDTNPKDLALKTSQGYLVIEQLKPAGGKEMTATAFLAGHRHLL